MLQINVKTFASDALEDAMRLAQTKALNSYSWSDCLNYLNYCWMDIYQQLALVDEGYYSVTVRLTKKLTKLPLCVKNSIRVFAAQTANTYNREIFRESGYNDLQGWNTYHISGFDLYCPDAERRTVWLNYVPQQKQLFFTRDNRDPKLYTDPEAMPTKVTTPIQLYNLWQVSIENINPSVEIKQFCYFAPAGALDTTKKMIRFHYRNNAANIHDIDATTIFEPAVGYRKAGGTFTEPEYYIRSFICDFPYIFVTYQHLITNEYWSGFYYNLPDSNEFVEYNPFAFTGRNSNVEYLQAKWNDKTGLGVIINDWNDMKEDKPVVKELGWTPDTLLVYPAPEMYRYFVARLADKLASLNESDMMAIQKELTEAEFAFKAFIGKDKSAWKRIDNVNGPSIVDWL
jgi:hypothetical protein